MNKRTYDELMSTASVDFAREIEDLSDKLENLAARLWDLSMPDDRDDVPTRKTLRQYDKARRMVEDAAAMLDKAEATVSEAPTGWN